MKEKGEQLRTLITGVLLFYLLIQIPFNYYIAGGKLSEVLTKTLVLTQILLPPLAVVLWAHHRKFFEDKFFPSKLNWHPGNWILMPLFAVSFYFLADALSDIIFILLPKELQQQLLNDIYAASYDFIQIRNSFDVMVIFAGFGLLAPILEELVFRGLVFSKIRENIGVNKATLYSAAFWGFLQMNPLDFLSLLIMGIILAYLVYRTDSLILPIGIQILFSLANLIVLNVVEKNEYLALPTLPEAIIYLILAVFGLYLSVQLTDYFYKKQH